MLEMFSLCHSKIGIPLSNIWTGPVTILHLPTLVQSLINLSTTLEPV